MAEAAWAHEVVTLEETESGSEGFAKRGRWRGELAPWKAGPGAMLPKNGQQERLHWQLLQWYSPEAVGGGLLHTSRSVQPNNQAMMDIRISCGTACGNSGVLSTFPAAPVCAGFTSPVGASFVPSTSIFCTSTFCGAGDPAAALPSKAGEPVAALRGALDMLLLLARVRSHSFTNRSSHFPS